jgi:hypothetical protein
MAARRLLVVMLILLVTSTLAAALVPPPPERDGTTSSTTSPRTSPVPPGGELVRAKIDAGAKRAETVRVPLGDQLALTVSSRRAGQVEIPALGLLEDVVPRSPARFDILAIRAGSFDVRLLEPARKVATIEVTDPSEREKGSRAGGMR